MADLPVYTVWYGTDSDCLDGSQAGKVIFGGADAGDGIPPFTFHDIQNASRDKWAGDSLPLWGKGCIIIFYQ